MLNLTNWHEFLLCLERAGFRGKKMISSENAIIFSYALWLIGRVDHGVPVAQLREVIARWFFMAQTTSRYSGSFETQVERDLAQLADIPARDADAFVAVLSKIIEDTLTTDFWQITLPNELSSSASKSPALLAYIAALNIVDADALVCRVSVPAVRDVPGEPKQALKGRRGGDAVRRTGPVRLTRRSARSSKEGWVAGLPSRALRARDDSRRGRRGPPVLQAPVLGAGDGQRRDRAGVRGVLPAVAEASVIRAG